MDGVVINMHNLQYIPSCEFRRVLQASLPENQRRKIVADMFRINTLYMIAKAGSGHIGSSFSSLDIISAIFLGFLRPGENRDIGFSYQDLFFSSKGHDAPAIYSCLIGLGDLNFSLIHALRRINGLPGHPDRSIPGMPCNTGSLGMGISKAKGFVRAARLQGLDRRCFVLTGDGELQEGQIWESLVTASNDNLNEITVIVDHNKIQSDLWVSRTSDLGDLEGKFRSFGWHVQSCDGHNQQDLAACLDAAVANRQAPSVIVAHTVKGAGVEIFQHKVSETSKKLYDYHSGAPSKESYDLALIELTERIDSLLGQEGLNLLELKIVAREQGMPPVEGEQRLVTAYGQALYHVASENPLIVALDADLKKDCGLIRFENEYPERFFECGIAEQDMVSMAGALSLSGLTPVVHSFSCFLTSRAAEQVYNNASERSKIVYVGSLSGVLPGGPGHSHQSVRDIGLMGGVPGMLVIEPSCAKEVPLALQACLDHEGPSFLRLVSIPCSIPYSSPAGGKLVKGQGRLLRLGEDVLFIGYGPVLLPQAWWACDLLEKKNIRAGVVNLPWLNTLDVDWLMEQVTGKSLVVTLDNHLLQGGQGRMIAASLGGAGVPPLISLGLRDFPPCGTNGEVLAALGLDAVGMCNAVLKNLV